MDRGLIERAAVHSVKVNKDGIVVYISWGGEHANWVQVSLPDGSIQNDGERVSLSCEVRIIRRYSGWFILNEDLPLVQAEADRTAGIRFRLERGGNAVEPPVWINLLDAAAVNGSSWCDHECGHYGVESAYVNMDTLTDARKAEYDSAFWAAAKDGFFRMSKESQGIISRKNRERVLSFYK